MVACSPCGEAKDAKSVTQLMQQSAHSIPLPMPVDHWRLFPIGAKLDIAGLIPGARWRNQGAPDGLNALAPHFAVQLDSLGHDAHRYCPPFSLNTWMMRA